jgi:hypothetical protein
MCTEYGYVSFTAWFCVFLLLLIFSFATCWQMFKKGRLQAACLLFYVFANLMSLCKLLVYPIVRILYFASVFRSRSNKQIMIFEESFPNYLILLAIMSYGI